MTQTKKTCTGFECAYYCITIIIIFFFLRKKVNLIFMR